MQFAAIQEGSAHKLWKECLNSICSRVKRQTFHTWFLPIQPSRLAEGTLTLEVANQFALDWINEHFRGLIDEALMRAAGPSLAFELRIADHAQPSEDQITSVVLPETLAGPPHTEHGGAPIDNRFAPAAHVTLEPPSTQPFQARVEVGRATRRRGNTTAGLRLSERYMFDNFVVGDSNQFAHAAALAVAEAGGSSRFNPLYIYGKVGLGKTHLAQAIGHHVLDLNPRAQVVYATSEKFTNDFITSLSAGSTAEFTQRYRTVDLLIVDDIQFFAGKESTQAQFFHTFNDLYQNGRRIVLTSDRPPREISGLEERLLSRFGWGLVTDIQPPDLETRIAILKKKTQNEQIDVPEEALVYIADQITSNIRELEGSLIRLLAYASLFGRDVTLELTREVLQDTFKSNRRPITIERVQKAVAAHFSLPMEAMWTKKKTQEVATARQVAMYLARELTGSPLKTIGANFGGRDHSTVIHACTQVSIRTKQDPGFKQHVDQIVNNLYS